MMKQFILGYVLLAGSAAVRAQGPATPDLCRVNPELEKKQFVLILQIPPGYGMRYGIKFAYQGCLIQDRNWDRDPVTPSAVRSYKGDIGGYILGISTKQDEADSKIEIWQETRMGGVLFAARLGSHPTAAILDSELDLGFISMADFRFSPPLHYEGRARLRNAP